MQLFVKNMPHVADVIWDADLNLQGHVLTDGGITHTLAASADLRKTITIAETLVNGMTPTYVTGMTVTIPDWVTSGSVVRFGSDVRSTSSYTAKLEAYVNGVASGHIMQTSNTTATAVTVDVDGLGPGDVVTFRLYSSAAQNAWAANLRVYHSSTVASAAYIE